LLQQRKYKKNLKAVYIIHASTIVRMTLKLFKPFLSSKFWKKLVYIEEVTDIYRVRLHPSPHHHHHLAPPSHSFYLTVSQYIRPDQLTLPDEVLTYKRESRASPLFGINLAAGCARTPTPSGLPIVCERAFEVLFARGTQLPFLPPLSSRLRTDCWQRWTRRVCSECQGVARLSTISSNVSIAARSSRPSAFPLPLAKWGG